MIIERKVFEPGMHDISNEEYHSSAGISRTGIKEFKRSPRHFWYKYVNPDYKRSPTASGSALEFGSALHTYVLEKNKFDNDYFISEKNPHHGSSTEGRKFKTDMLLKSKHKILIDDSDFSTIKSMSDSINSDDEARELITGATYEKSIYWIDPDTQLLCKCRPDIIHDNFIVDLKTTADASYKEFQRSFYNYGYHLQVAMIQQGFEHALNKSMRNFIDLAVEKTEPFSTAVYLIDESTLQHGIDEFKHYLVAIKECIDNDSWPSYATKTIILPAYATFGE